MSEGSPAETPHPAQVDPRGTHDRPWWLPWVIRGGVIVILLTLVAYLGNRQVEAFDQQFASLRDRLKGVEGSLEAVQGEFDAFKNGATATHEKLEKSIRMLSRRMPKEVREQIELWLSTYKTEVHEDISREQDRIDGLEAQLRVLSKSNQDSQTQLAEIANQIGNIRTRLDTIWAESKAAERERISIEARGGLELLDNQYLYSKAHRETTIRIAPGSGFVGQTIRIPAPQEEYQLSTAVTVDYEDGTLIVAGKIKNASTKQAIRKALRGIEGVDSIEDNLLEVE